MLRGNFPTIINVFATLDAALMEHLEKDAKTPRWYQGKFKITYLNVYLIFFRSIIKDKIPDYYAIISDEVTDRFYNKKTLTFCLGCVKFCANEKP